MEGHALSGFVGRTKRFIAGGACYEVKAFNGKIMTHDGDVVYVTSHEGYNQLTRIKESAKTFQTVEEARNALGGADGHPWYYKLKPETGFVQDVSDDLHRMSKDELIARIHELTVDK